MKLWKRDYLILQDLANNYHCTSQIAKYFTSQGKTSKRLRKLFLDGYVSRFVKPTLTLGKSEYVYRITKKGILALRMQGFDISISPRFKNERLNVYSVEHSLYLNDLRIWFTKGISKEKSLTSKFFYGKRFFPSGLKEHRLEPDAHLVIFNVSKKKALLHFIEGEFGNEVIESNKSYSFSEKFQRYCAYFDSLSYTDDFKEIFGCDFKGFRVLVIVKGKERLDRILKLSLQNDAEFFWFASKEDVSEETILGPIWAYGDKKKQSLIWLK